MSVRAWRGVRFLVVVGAAVVASTVACSSTPDASRTTFVLEPDFDVYKANVDYYLNRQCGTLDCHGQPGRAMRLYGQNGFRLYNEDAGLVSGQQPTTDGEKRANFEAIVGLEPEEMSRFIATQGADPTKLLFLRKPLHLERHKGGQVMEFDDPGYRCVVAWLQVATYDGNGQPIPKEKRKPFTPTQIDACAKAQSFE